MSDEQARTLFIVRGTAINVKPVFLANLLALWGGLSWLARRRVPERSWPACLLVGAGSALALLAADLGHAVAHIFSARYAGAPMDEVLISEGMPRTLYEDNDVSPRVHRLRALGGPIFSAVGLLVSLLLRSLTPRDSTMRELVNWSCLGHGFILTGSLAPLPMVDGGSILKWTLVERGRTPVEADTVVRQVDLAMGAAATAAGATLALRRHWLPALGLAAAGVLALAIGLRGER